MGRRRSGTGLLLRPVGEADLDGLHGGEERVIAVEGCGGDAEGGAVEDPGVPGDGGDPLVEQVHPGALAVVAGGVGAAGHLVGLAVDGKLLDVHGPIGVQGFAVHNAQGTESHAVGIALIGAGEIQGNGVFAGLGDQGVTRTIMGRIGMLFDILDTTEDDVRQALMSNMTDYEDAVMVETAKREKMDCIVTRNLADYKQAGIPVYSPREFMVRV